MGLARLWTFIILILTMVPFASSLSAILDFWKGLFLRWTTIAIDVRVMVLLATSIGIDLIMLYGDGESVFLRWPVWARATSIAVVLLALFLVSQADFRPPFVYQGF
jgi:hypothetical protein